MYSFMFSRYIITMQSNLAGFSAIIMKMKFEHRGCVACKVSSQASDRQTDRQTKAATIQIAGHKTKWHWTGLRDCD